MAAQTCTGDCLKCSFQQQTYCAAQRSYGIMKNQEAIVARLDALAAALAAFTPGQVFNPMEDNAQKGSGADNKEHETTT